MLGQREGSSHKPKAKVISLHAISFKDLAVPGEEQGKKRLEILRSFKYTVKEQEEVETLVEALQNIFKERPVWLKSSLEIELENKNISYSSSFLLKKVLSSIAYLFKNGPWKFTYCKFGYDPRSDKKAMIYQSFYVGVFNRNFLSTQGINSGSNQLSLKGAIEDNPTTMTDYKRRKYQSIQLVDVKDASIQQMLVYLKKDNESNYHQMCDPKYGWIYDKKYYCFIVKKIKDLIR